MMARIRLIAVVLMAAACACPAQKASSSAGGKKVIWEPPRIDWPDSLPTSTVPKEMIGSLRVANFPIVLEETKLEDAQRRFGGMIGSCGDAGDAEAWLCLHGRDANGPWIFWLTSGEIDGPAIGGFEWRRLAPNELPDHRCPLLRKGDGGIALPLQLHPGMTEVEMRRILGRPTIARGRTLIFFHEHQETIQNLPYTSENTITIVLRGGLVLAIQVSKTTSS
jgi:hypothetical protein